MNRYSSAAENFQELSCGSSIAEAQRRGCTFDYLAKSWLHPKCPRIGTEEFLELGEGQSEQSWTYWQDDDAEAEFNDISKLASNESNPKWWWSTEEEHLNHFAYMLVRLAHAFHEGTRIDSKSGDLHHAKHCMFNYPNDLFSRATTY